MCYHSQHIFPFLAVGLELQNWNESSLQQRHTSPGFSGSLWQRVCSHKLIWARGTVASRVTKHCPTCQLYRSLWLCHLLSNGYWVKHMVLAAVSDAALVFLTPQEGLPMPSQFAMPWTFQRSFGPIPESFSNIRWWWLLCVNFNISETQPKIQEGFSSFWTLILGLSILSFESVEGLLGNLLICHPICLEALAYSPAEREAQRFGRWEAEESWQCYCIQLRFLSEEAGRRWKHER